MPEIRPPIARLPAPAETVRWGELYGSSPSYFLAEAAATAPAPFLVVAGSGREADQCLAELRFYLAGRVPPWSFPDRETLPYDPFSPHPDIVSERLRTLAALPDLSQGVVVTTQAALLDRLAPRSFISTHAFALAAGERVDLSALRKRLVDAGYVQVTQVLSPGEFAVRGSVVDLYPAGAPQPFRLDLFDDFIESVRGFDPASQRSGTKLPAIPLLPAREIPSSPEAITEFRARWRERFEGDPQACPVYRAVTAGQVPAGIEAWLPFFFGKTSGLSDYLPAGTVIVDLVDLDRALPAYGADIDARYEERRHDRERPLLPPAQAFVPASEALAALTAHPRIVLTPVKVEPIGTTVHFENFGAEPPPELRADSRVPEPLEKLAHFAAAFEGQLLVAADSAGRREVLLDMLRRQGLTADVAADWPTFAASGGALGLAVAPDVRGLLLPGRALAVVAEDQLFGERARQERRRRRAERDPEAILRDLATLTPGAPVVHEEYGVGRYRGLKVMQVAGNPAEFLVIEYAGGDLLYVPVHALGLVTRYTGGSPESAPWHKLGTEQWVARAVAPQTGCGTSRRNSWTCIRAAQRARAALSPSMKARFAPSRRRFRSRRPPTSMTPSKRCSRTCAPGGRWTASSAATLDSARRRLHSAPRSPRSRAGGRSRSWCRRRSSRSSTPRRSPTGSRTGPCASRASRASAPAPSRRP